MRVLSLFSGGGLGDYGLMLAGMEIVGQVEIDEYCQKILKLRWPDVPKWRDIRDVKGEEIKRVCGTVDLISGGFPCQDISFANPKGDGINGERSGLWKEYFRLICELRPKYCIVENVTALLVRGMGVVIGDLAEIGYFAEWECIPASCVGAWHRRDRVWIVAYSDIDKYRRAFRKSVETEKGIQKQDRKENSSMRKSCGTSQVRKSCKNDVPYSESTRFTSGIMGSRQNELGRSYSRNRELQGAIWSAEPCVGRVAHGIANRVDRLKLLGNGQVVQVVQWIGERIMEFDKSLIPEE